MHCKIIAAKATEIFFTAPTSQFQPMVFIDALFALFWNMGTSYETCLLKRTFSFLKKFYTVLLVGYVVAGVFSWTKSSDQYLH